MRERVGLPAWPSAPALLDRRAERRVLDELVQAVRAGESRALVVHGEAGIGKTALLDYTADHAPGCRVQRIAGVESEMELPWAAVHQLCAPLMDGLGGLPAPQRDAVSGAFGLSEQPAADPFLVGLGVLGVLSQAAEERSLVCLIDDQQWLDFASARILSFVARRLGWESLALIFTARVPNDHVKGLPELPVGGLPAADVGVLLELTLPGKLDSRVRDRIVAETGGNPLALVELTRGMTADQLAFGLELPGSVPLAGVIEDRFADRVGALPDDTRRLLILAASEPVGDPVLLWHAANRLGIGREAQEPAIETGLADFAPRVTFRHPLVRAAAYRSASIRERQLSHQALAEVTDAQLDPERRAWHRAQAAMGPDEQAAAELEAGADLALARGCLAAAGAYLQRAVTLSVDPVRRCDRAIVAAEGKIRAGAFDAGVELLAIAEAGPLTDLQQARIHLVRAQLAYVANRGGEAPVLLQNAAHRLEAVDADLARATYLDALSAAIFAGRLAAPGGGIVDVAQAAAALLATDQTPRPLDALLRPVATSYLDDEATAIVALREALANFGVGMPPDQELRWTWLVCMTAIRALDDERWAMCAARHLRLARDAGALTELPLALSSQTFVLLFAGDLAAARELVDETEAVKTAIGSKLAPYGALAFAAIRGDVTTTDDLVTRTIADATERGEGIGITMAEWADALLSNGIGDYGRALAAAKRATEYEPDLRMLSWPVAELIEAAARAGDTETAHKAYRRLKTTTTASGTDWAVGLEARSHALLAEGGEAEKRYLESIDRLGRTRQRTDLARAHLLYGEWLRRARRRIESREQLGTAQQMFEAMGMEGFAERANRELRTAGQTARKRKLDVEPGELTPQEAQVARLAREGLTNLEIGTRLFISSHTVQYHLRKVFTKLDITSRAQLDRALSQNATGQGGLTSDTGPRHR